MKEFLENYVQNDVLKHILYARALRTYLCCTDKKAAGMQIYKGFMNFTENLTIFCKTDNECNEDDQVYSILDARGKRILRARVGKTTRALSAKLIVTSFAYFLKYTKYLYRTGDKNTLQDYSECEDIFISKKESKKELKTKANSLQQQNAALLQQLAALRQQLAALQANK